MATRAQDLQRVAELVGGGITIVDRRDGWPGIVSIGEQRFSVHVGPIGPSHRERDNVERRFQNPGSSRPIAVIPGTSPLLLGIWENGAHPVLVAADAARRIGLMTRYSVFTPLEMLRRAAHVGWAEHRSSSDELLVAFHPALLPAFVGMQLSGATVNPNQVAGVVDASGLLDSAVLPPGERARRATMSIVRDAAFSREIIEAYGGLCAMCGLDLGLCQGAHIYPASAPGSLDHVTNGLALCGNHHLAFDRHLIWVEPERRQVVIQPSVLERAALHPPTMTFVECTARSLREPMTTALRPAAEMFVKRYAHFEDQYAWVGR